LCKRDGALYLLVVCFKFVILIFLQLDLLLVELVPFTDGFPVGLTSCVERAKGGKGECGQGKIRKRNERQKRRKEENRKRKKRRKERNSKEGQKGKRKRKKKGEGSLRRGGRGVDHDGLSSSFACLCSSSSLTIFSEV